MDPEHAITVLNNDLEMKKVDGENPQKINRLYKRYLYLIV